MSGRAIQLAIHVSWSKAREPGLRKSQPFHTAEQQSKFMKLDELKQKGTSRLCGAAGQAGA